MSKSWAVVGASGFVGSAIAGAAAGAGHNVSFVAAPRLLADGAWSPEDVVDSVSRLEDRIQELSLLLSGKDVVVNAAGLATPDAQDSPELHGANAALPALLLLAARRAGAGRFLHISSGAVQGRKPVLDSSWEQAPFSPYSRSKALGERVLRLLMEQETVADRTKARIIRATSIQDPRRTTTSALERFARSPLASVAGTGNAPSPVSSIEGLAGFVLRVGDGPLQLPAVSVQPWEGLTVRDVLLRYGLREPLHLPPALCKFLLGAGYSIARLGIRGVEGTVRRAEVLWFGQGIEEQGRVNADA